MALIGDKDFVFTNNLSMRKALAEDDNVEVMAEMFDLEEDDLKDHLKKANWNIESFSYVAENTNSFAMLALVYKMEQEGIR